MKKDESSVFIWFGILIIALVLTTIGFLVFAVGRKKSKEGMIAGGPGKSKNGITEKEN